MTIVLFRGVNVGGHRTFRPSALAKYCATRCREHRRDPVPGARDSNAIAGRWCVRMLEREGRLVVGVPTTTRNWNTVEAVGRVLGS